MCTSDADGFRTRQSAADLRHAASSFSPATFLRVADGFGRRRSEVARRLHWLATGKAPPSALSTDRQALAAVLVASALPEDDPPAFLLATAILLLERLDPSAGPESHFWSWRRLAPHWRAAGTRRPALMCGFREALRMGRVALDGAPDPADCLTRPREAVLGLLASVADPLAESVADAIAAEADADAAGALWSASADAALALPAAARAAVLAGFRHLYERPLSLSSGDAPTIPPDG